jgi:hypothetical protein
MWCKLPIGLAAAMALQLAVGGSGAGAQVITANEDKLLIALAERIDRFFESVSSGQAQTAYVNLLAGSPLLKQNEQVAALVRKTAEIDKTFGAYRGFEQILARRVGKDLVLMRYLYKCENFPIVWYVAFYRDQREPSPGSSSNGVDSWRAISIRFDTDLDALAR